MVVRIKDRGLLLRRLPLPGFGRFISFDEMDRVEWVGNGRKRQFVLHCAGDKPVVVKGMSADSARQLMSELEEILHPALARQSRALLPHEIDEVVASLCDKKGIRPSVLLSFLLDQALLHRATDLHLEQIDAAYRARFRVDGILRDVAAIPETMRQRLIAHIKNAAGLASYRRDVPQEGRLTHQPHEQDPMVIRLSVVPAHEEESVVLRLFDALRGSLDLNTLGFSPEVRAGFGDLLEQPRGLILFSGPSSSGKTTTTYASLQHLMKGPRTGERAVSLEDPIEFPLGCASQIEVAPHKGLTFDRLLSNVLRQDVEVIVVGEIRDGTTAAIALRAALTGHLILSTLHCGRAAEVPRRLVDLGLGPGDVSEALKGVVTLRLVRVLCPHCRVQASITGEDRQRMDLPLWLETVHEARGCPQCMETGYQGRTAVAELMPVGPEIADMIRENAPISRILQELRQAGMADIRDDALKKAAQGITSLSEIRRVLK